MSLKTWILSRGLVGAIARDVFKKYSTVKKTLSDDSEKAVIKGVWDLYLYQNAPEILAGKDGIHKHVRLDIIMESVITDDKRHHSLMEVFMDILYVETEINLSSGQRCMDSLMVFVKEGRKNGFNFMEEYNSYSDFLPLISN